MKKMNQRRSLTNAVSLIVIAGCLVWLFSLRERLAIFVSEPDFEPSMVEAWAEVSGGLDWSLPMEAMRGVVVRNHPLEGSDIDAALDRIGMKMAGNGWVAVDQVQEGTVPGMPHRLFQKGVAYRVFLAMAAFGDGEGEGIILDVTFDEGSWKGDFAAENFSMEDFFHRNSRDLEGLPGPAGARRFFSLLAPDGSGFVSYQVDGEPFRAYGKYVEQLESLGWVKMSQEGNNALTLFSRNDGLLLVGIQETLWDDRCFLTVLRHGQ